MPDLAAATAANDPYVAGRTAAADRLGLDCEPLPDGTLTVAAEPHRDADPGRRYTVTFTASRGRVLFRCTCRAGEFRSGPVPCKHAAAAGRFMERSGLAVFGPDGWRLTLFAAAVGLAAVPSLPR